MGLVVWEVGNCYDPDFATIFSFIRLFAMVERVKSFQTVGRGSGFLKNRLATMMLLLMVSTRERYRPYGGSAGRHEARKGRLRFCHLMVLVLPP